MKPALCGAVLALGPFSRPLRLLSASVAALFVSLFIPLDGFALPVMPREMPRPWLVLCLWLFSLPLRVFDLVHLEVWVPFTDDALSVQALVQIGVQVPIVVAEDPHQFV